ncbi:MAG: hypothetical protein QRY72_05430 [Candidatus Rhabdochlamydia sp.]
MKLNQLIWVGVCVLFTGCYKITPDEHHISTIPTTNNPHAMPGIRASTSFPSTF